MKRIDWTTITKQSTADKRVAAADAEIARVGYVCLTDALTHRNEGGGIILEKLDPNPAPGKIQALPDAMRRTYKIQIIRDQWGDPPVPGEKFVYRKRMPIRDAAGRKIRSDAAGRMRLTGEFEKKFISKEEFEIDEKGCIECSFEVASSLLYLYGVHFETGLGICGKRELSSGPCRVLGPNGTPLPVIDEHGNPRLGPQGQTIHLEKYVWYWRYKEAPPWVYETLPILGTKQDDTKPAKRGRKKKNVERQDGVGMGDVEAVAVEE